MKMIGAFILFVSMITIANGAPVMTQKVAFTAPDRAIIVTQKNPSFQLTLQSNPSTGYSWFLAQYNSHLIEPVKQEYVAAKTKLLGAPGYEVWTFKVRKNAFIVPHVTKIVMRYARPWVAATHQGSTTFVVTIR